MNFYVWMATHFPPLSPIVHGFGGYIYRISRTHPRSCRRHVFFLFVYVHIFGQKWWWCCCSRWYFFLVLHHHLNLQPKHHNLRWSHFNFWIWVRGDQTTHCYLKGRFNIFTIAWSTTFTNNLVLGPGPFDFLTHFGTEIKEFLAISGG